MELIDLEYIVAVAEEGNLSRAASRLFISQPTLSQAIKKVETQIGYALFIRIPKGMCVTEKGAKFIQQATQIVQMKEQIRSEMKLFSNEKAGNLSIGVPTIWGGYILSRVFPSFYSAYPNINVTVNETKSSLLEDTLIEEKIDLAIVALPELNMELRSTLDYFLLLSEEILIAIPPDNPLTKALTISPGNEFPLLSPQSLQYQPMINYKMDAPLRAVADFIFRQHELSPEIVANVSSASTAKQLSLCGLGYTLIPRTFAKYCMSPPHPIYCALNVSPHPRLKLMLALRKRQRLTPYMEFFIELLKKVTFQ